MIARFCLYSVFKNLRFADPFLVLFLLELDLSYGRIGLLLGFERLLMALLEVPSGVVADGFGRRRALAVSFLFYAASFVLFPWAGARVSDGHAAWLYVPAALFAFGEAFRTGSHKAIMLDWLDSRGEAPRATSVIALARTFSKAGAGVSAGAGGLLLYFTHRYDVLFHLSAAAAGAGFLVLLSYPRTLEGERTRARSAGRPVLTLLPRLSPLTATAGILPLFFQSVIFESQTKLLLKYYLQPFLKDGLAGHGIVILGAGALWVGFNELVREGLGGAGAWMSPAFERRVGGAGPALHRAYALAVALSVGVGLSYVHGWLLAGLVLLVAVTVLQNLRRPIFVAAFNRVMDRPNRATTLSIESQSRSLAVAVLLPVTGFAADRWGLGSVFPVISVLLMIGLLIRVGRGQSRGT